LKGRRAGPKKRKKKEVSGRGKGGTKKQSHPYLPRERGGSATCERADWFPKRGGRGGKVFRKPLG